MGILQVIGGRERDLGGFVVRRVLPAESRQMVGPFIFFDHLGPVQFAPGTGIDVRPHPHIGLATVTYLFSGALSHRDSLGNVQEIVPGDVNWMTAGAGIAHSERTPHAARAQGSPAHGIQSWVALPDGAERVAPQFTHYPSASLPRLERGGARLAVIAGEAYGLASPVKTYWPTVYVEAQLAAGARVNAPGHEEQALYVMRGEVSVSGDVLHEGQLGLLEAASEEPIEARAESHFMLLGGARFPTPRHIWWNFVASSREMIDEAKQRWAQRGFAQVPGETEFIPLPHP